jgi:Aldo/keto reductase family
MVRVEQETVELSDATSVDGFAARFLASGRPLHLLINNAGIMAIPQAKNARGFDLQFATNHLGHFQLTARLWPARTSRTASSPRRFTPTLKTSSSRPSSVASGSPTKGGRRLRAPRSSAKAARPTSASYAATCSMWCTRYMGKASPVPFTESLDAMIAMKREGKIRHLGLSNVGPAELEVALARTPIVSVQNLYSVAGGGGAMARMTHAEVPEPERVLEMCEKHRIAYMPFFPLGVGAHAKPTAAVASVAERHRVTPAQIALAWLLARSPIMLPIPGTSRVLHVEENWAARSIHLTADEVKSIAAASREA